MRETRVAWLSGMFGFGEDLAYFSQILGEFGRRFPYGVALVRKDYPIGRYPELPLKPELAFWVKKHDRVVDGFVYTGNRRIPTPATFWSLVRMKLDAMIVVEFTPTAIAGLLASRLARRPVVMLVESQPRFRGGGDTRAHRIVKGWLAKLARVVQVSSEATRDYVVTSLGVPERKVLVGPYLTSEPRLVEALRRPTDPVRFLFLNSLQERKGLHLLVAALAATRTKPTDRDWQLQVVGDGPQRAQVEADVVRLGLESRVSFCGRVGHDRVGEFYARADVVVCPTQGDYRSLAGFEAVNAGRPVILSSRDGAADEIVGSGAAATAVDPLDVDAFAAALNRFLVGDHLEAQLSQAATPPSQFSVESVGSNVQAAVDRAVADPR